MKPEGAMAREIESQPAVLEAVRRRVLEPGALAALRRGVERVWFVGCGDMRFAAEGAADLAATAWGAPCRARSSMDLRWWDRVLGPEDLVVAALHNAAQAAKDLTEKKMGPLTAGLGGLGGGLGLPGF